MLVDLALKSLELWTGEEAVSRLAGDRIQPSSEPVSFWV